MSLSQEGYAWDTNFLSPDKEHRNPLALIVLNQTFAHSTFANLWAKCQWKIFADGGSNRVYDAFNQEGRLRFLPDRIKGDFDSIRPEVRSWYEEQGVTVEHDEDQDSTDLMKCLSWIDGIERDRQLKVDVVILGGLSGRLDHTIHTMSLLHKLRSTRPRIFAVGDSSVGWVLDQGHHRLELDLRFVGPTCGLLPVGIASSVVTTTGLKWNLGMNPCDLRIFIYIDKRHADNTESSFDGLVSTSNSILPVSNADHLGRVTVATSKPIWWCVEHRRSDVAPEVPATCL